MRPTRQTIRLVLVLALAATSFAVAVHSGGDAVAAPADRVELAPPGMDMDAQDVPLFTGESGYLFYIDERDVLLRWAIDGSTEPLELSREPNGVDAVTADGSKYRVGLSVYEITGDSYERMRPDLDLIGCPGDERNAAVGYSPSLTVAVASCIGGRTKVYTYSTGATRTFELNNIPDKSVQGDVVVNDDGSFRLILGVEGGIFGGPGVSTPGKLRLEYDRNGNPVSVREPQRTAPNTAAQYKSRTSAFVDNAIDPIGGTGFETAGGQIVAFDFAQLQPPPRVKQRDLFPPGTPLFSFTYVHALTATGFGAVCLLSPEVGEPRWCYEGDLLNGGGRWFEHTIGGYDVGSITGDGKWYSRKLSASTLFVEQVVFAAAPDERVCFDVAGTPGDYAVVNLTPVEALGGGFARLVSSDLKNPPSFSNANFAPGSIDPNVAIAPIGANGQVCIVNSEHTSVHLIADHLGTIKRNAFTPARTNGTPQRKIDTRPGQ